MSRSISRRSFIKNTSGGVAAAVGSGVLGGSAIAAPKPASEIRAPEGDSDTWIHQNLQPGMQILSDWFVQRISPLHLGAVVILLENRRNHEVMRIDVCKMVDYEPAVGVENTKNHEFIVMNGGDGHKWTHRRYHLVVRAMARLLDSADAKMGNKSPLLTHKSRVEVHGPTAVAANPFDSLETSSE